jgi:hypothetical protein
MVPEGAEKLLPELTKLPIDWGTPLARWSRQQLVELIKGIGWLFAERGTLDSSFWAPRPVSFPWSTHRRTMGQERPADGTESAESSVKAPDKP